MSRLRSASDPMSPPGGSSERIVGPSRAAALRPAGPRQQPTAVPESSRGAMTGANAQAGPSRLGQSQFQSTQASDQGHSPTTGGIEGERRRVKHIDLNSPSSSIAAGPATPKRPSDLRRRNTPPSPLAYCPTNPSPALTQAALSALASAPPTTRPSYPYPFAHHSFPAGVQADTQTGTGRLNGDESTDSSSTTDEEGDGDGDENGRGADRDGLAVSQEVDEEVKRWAAGPDRKGKGKAKDLQEGGVESLPGEVLMQIFGLLETRDLLNALKVNKTWCLSAFPLLWTRPSIRDTSQLASLVRVLMTPAQRLTLPYTNYVRRISLVALGLSLTDDLLLGLSACKRVERLTLSGASSISNAALRTVIAKMPDIVAVDLANTEGTDHTVLQALGENCPRLNGLNLSECKGADARGLKAIAEGCLPGDALPRLMKQLKLVGCHRQTDATIVHLVQSCPLLIELNLGRIAQLTDASLQAIWLNSVHMRELCMGGNDAITDEAFLDLTDIPEDIAYAQIKHDGIPPSLVPKEYTLEHLRVLDFTGCTQIGDKAIERLVRLAPRTRDLTLAKCTRLTDDAVEHICKLGRHLHHLHLGHVDSLTDRAITQLARACTRIRYLDLGCCPRLTDIAVFEIAASMTKLRRLGLVKMTLLSDDGLAALAERRHTLERVHLSYCDKLSIWGMQHFLNRMTKLSHMSLTGVKAFKTKQYKQFSKEPPKEFNDHQRKSFNVFSAQGIASMRNWLNDHLVLHPRSELSSQRGSHSSASSFTAPNGNSSPTEAVQGVAQHAGPSLISSTAAGPTVRWASAQEAYDDEDEEDPAYDRSFAYTMYTEYSPTSATFPREPGTYRADAGPSRLSPRAPGSGYLVPVLQTGLEAAFASTVPDFINGVQNLNLTDEPETMEQPRVLPHPAHTVQSPNNRQAEGAGRSRQYSADRPDRVWPRMPGAYISNRGSRASSISSVDTNPSGVPPPGHGPTLAAAVPLHQDRRAGPSRPPTSAAAAFQAQYIAEQGRGADTDVRLERPAPSIPAGLVRGTGHRQRANTATSPLASSSSAFVPPSSDSAAAGRFTGSVTGGNGPYRSARMQSADSTSSNPSGAARPLGGPSSNRASMGNIYALSQPQPYPPPSSYHGHARATSGTWTPNSPANPPSRYPGITLGTPQAGPSVAEGHSSSMDRNRERSGSGSSFSSLTGLTEGIRGAVRRSSVSQVVQAAVAGAGEGSPLRWVAEMVGWNPEDEGRSHGDGPNGRDHVQRQDGHPAGYQHQHRHNSAGGPHDRTAEGWRYREAGGVNDVHRERGAYEPMWQIERRSGSRERDRERERQGEVRRGNGGRRGTTG